MRLLMNLILASWVLRVLSQRRPTSYPSTLLKLYIYAYLNRVQSSRRLEREAQRNVELMWLTERLSPDHKTIADFRKDNSKALRGVCREFVVLCRRLNHFTQALVVIDGSKFKAVNNRDRNFTRAKMKRRLAQVEDSLDRNFEQLEQSDREETSLAEDKTTQTSRVLSFMTCLYCNQPFWASHWPTIFDKPQIYVITRRKPRNFIQLT